MEAAGTVLKVPSNSFGPLQKSGGRPRDPGTALLRVPSRAAEIVLQVMTQSGRPGSLASGRQPKKPGKKKVVKMPVQAAATVLKVPSNSFGTLQEAWPKKPGNKKVVRMPVEAAGTVLKVPSSSFGTLQEA